MKMDVSYINPFIESVNELFSTMLEANISRGTIGVSRGAGNPRDIVAIIGLSGPARGTVALSFPTATALSLVNKLLGLDTHIVDENISDGVAELVNIVAGSAKAKLVGDGGAVIDLSLPTVLRGNDFTVDYPSQSMWLEVPFESDYGAFSLRVTFEYSNSK